MASSVIADFIFAQSAPSPANVCKVFNRLMLGVDFAQANWQSIWNHGLTVKVFYPDGLTGGGSLFREQRRRPPRLEFER